MIDPNADLADIRRKWLTFCAVHDDLCLGDLPCCCAREDHRPVIAALVGEVETQRAEVERLNRTAELIQETHTKAMSDSVRECRQLIAEREAMRAEVSRRGAMVVESAQRLAEVEAQRSPAMEDCSMWLEEHKARREAFIAAVDQMANTTVPSAP